MWDLATRSLIRNIVTKEVSRRISTSRTRIGLGTDGAPCRKQNTDVLSLSLIDSDLYTCLSDGEVQRWSGSFACTAEWKAHGGIVLSSIIVPPSSSTTNLRETESDAGEGDVFGDSSGWTLITGASDNHIKVRLYF